MASLTSELTRAELLIRAGMFANQHWAGYPPALLPAMEREERTSRFQQSIGVCMDIMRRSRRSATLVKAQKLLRDAVGYMLRDNRDLRYYREHVASRREDNESWNAAGWYCVTTFDSYTFSTQPFPYEYACSTARIWQDKLTALGHETVLDSPNHVSRSQRCPYWGGSYSADTGTVCVLVKCGTPMELELIRRELAQAEHVYWKGVADKCGWKWDETACGYRTSFRDWK
jgi:hypothetical protein